MHRDGFWSWALSAAIMVSWGVFARRVGGAVEFRYDVYLKLGKYKFPMQPKLN